MNASLKGATACPHTSSLGGPAWGLDWGRQVGLGAREGPQDRNIASKKGRGDLVIVGIAPGSDAQYGLYCWLITLRRERSQAKTTLILYFASRLAVGAEPDPLRAGD